MLKNILYLPVRLILIIAGFLFVVKLPFLLGFDSERGKAELDFAGFGEAYRYAVKSFIDMVGIRELKQYLAGDGLESYLYTMNILSVSILVVVIAGIVGAVVIMLLPQKIRKPLTGIVNFTATAPELLIIFLLQYLVIYIYKTYHIKLFSLYGFFNASPKFAPIFIASFLPAIFYIQLVVKEFLNEEQQEYVLFARSKGLNYKIIYLKHIYRNIAPYCLIHFRIVVWFLLTNIYVMEYLFSLKGFMLGMFQFSDAGYLIALLMFAVPILLATGLGKVGTFLLNRKEKTTL
ncbi:ABC transporter permease subunit [Neobacillus niacini]|uniref:ABC transporter permease subunit n=1 Tax=Neobacillus niacini TaxID=86668 RepID=UPI0021CB8C6A|nr:ABC transporter permease subunit [Neobacillus niacini]MCM3764045.1 ABC transporter permease subunit [Neobacillus niacini]